MIRTTFATPVFSGARFDGNGVPVDVLPELAAYRDLVVAWAKHLWSADNPNRRRLPKGFEDGFRLMLERVEPGSARPVLERWMPEDEQPQLFNADYFDQARDKIAHVLGEVANDNADCLKDLPDDLFQKFNRLGRKLRPDEYIEFRRDRDTPGPRYDRTTRMRILREVGRDYEDDVDVVGQVTEARRAGDKSFRLDLADAPNVIIECGEDRFSVGTWALHSGQTVRVLGTGIYSASGQLLRVTTVDDVVVQGPVGASSKIGEQIESLRALEDGWLDGEGFAIDGPGLDWVAAVLNRMVASKLLPFPFIYPTEEGGVRVEWSTDRWELGVTFDLASHHARALAADMQSDDFEESQFDWLDKYAESKLVAFVVDHLKEEGDAGDGH
jgi:hypothetical protein